MIMRFPWAFTSNPLAAAARRLHTQQVAANNRVSCWCGEPPVLPWVVAFAVVAGSLAQTSPSAAALIQTPYDPSGTWSITETILQWSSSRSVHDGCCNMPRMSGRRRNLPTGFSMDTHVRPESG